MENTHIPYLRFGHRITCNGELYRLICQPDRNAKEAECVKDANWRRYQLLAAWEQNGVYKGRPEETQNATEKAGYVTTVPLPEAEMAEEIRFIDPQYNTKFKVRSGGRVKVNGESRTVFFIDEYHFTFLHDFGYHICQFAEICERHSAVVEKECD